ncbi:2-hydroxychromene-2-carboxylate isomerase protein [Pseudomonas amygdali pv. lachrymans]|nr:2-hydroxychromene-2-carboxylate isomerase protein [Pseudomonas amygdali pv. lachrymans]
MTTALKIDFISDVSCPWCVIGLRALDQALEALGDEVQAHIHFQPFELNPNMPAEGQDIKEHIAEKYGSTPEQIEGIHETIRERGAELGFNFAKGERRIYNTFDAHRLLHWAEQQGKQYVLKQALFEAYFSDLKDPSSHQTLADVAQKVGLAGPFACSGHPRQRRVHRRGPRSRATLDIPRYHLRADHGLQRPVRGIGRAAG